MAGRIAVIDFPPKGKKTSYFVVNDKQHLSGDGGLVGRVREHDYQPILMDYRELNPSEFDPNKFLAVFYASGWTPIRDEEAKKKDEKTRKINPRLVAACEIYGKCIEARIPIFAFTHGSEILAFHTGGNYFELKEERKRFGVHAGYQAAHALVNMHWLFKNIPIEKLVCREYRGYGIDVEGSQFEAYVNPYFKEAGPAIAIHRDPVSTAVLFMIHPEYDRDLSAYRLMDNVFAQIAEQRR